MIADLRSLVGEGHDAVVDIRRTVHARPELAHREHATTALLRGRLRSLGWTELPAPTPTGAVFELTGGRPGRSVLVRADIDALPVEEALDVPWRSNVPGVMHACGHDAHVAMLAGVAAVLAARAEDLPGRYVAVAQPAEELAGGAVAMLDGGLLETARVDAAVGAHVSAPLPTGLVATRPGVYYAACRPFTVLLAGRGGHGALAAPGVGGVLLAAAELASRLGVVATGMSFDDVDCVCSAGALHAGTAPNVVPAQARVSGTIRTFTAEQSAETAARLRALTAEVAARHDVAAEIVEAPFVPAIVNDPPATGVVTAALAAELGPDAVVEVPPFTVSDDMSEILARVPGLYLAVGARPGRGVPPQHHAADFTIDEDAMAVGVRALSVAAIALATPG